MAVEDPCQLQQIMAVLEFTAMGLNMYPSTVVQFEFISIQTIIVHQELIFQSSGYPSHGKVEIALFHQGHSPFSISPLALSLCI